MTRYSSSRDLTARQAAVHQSQAPTLSWLCGHKAVRAGGLIRAGLLWRCARCVVARRGNAA